MCRVYSVTREGFNSWRTRGVSARKQYDDELFILINQIFEKHDGNYGSPKITHELAKQNIHVGQKRVARIMREHGLRAIKAVMYRTKKGKTAFVSASPNMIAEKTITGVDQVWSGDVTYIRMPDDTWRYLAVIIDRFSRSVISWSLSDRRDGALTVAALERAFRNRGFPKGVIFHSDRGIEYIAKTFRKRLALYGISQSMNRPNKMNDNAQIESFFNSFKVERLKRKFYSTDNDVRGLFSSYVRYYNYERSHSSIGYVSPMEYESKKAA